MNIFGVGLPEIAVIVALALVVFGPKKLPELFRSFGKSIKEFKKASSEIEDDIRTAMETEPDPKSTDTAEKELNLKADDK